MVQGNGRWPGRTYRASCASGRGLGASAPRACHTPGIPVMEPPQLSQTLAAADAVTTENRDVSHAAKSGAMQVVTVLSQAILPLTHVLVARLFGTAVFGAYQ